LHNDKDFATVPHTPSPEKKINAFKKLLATVLQLNPESPNYLAQATKIAKKYGYSSIINFYTAMLDTCIIYGLTEGIPELCKRGAYLSEQALFKAAQHRQPRSILQLLRQLTNSNTRSILIGYSQSDFLPYGLLYLDSTKKNPLTSEAFFQGLSDQELKDFLGTPEITNLLTRVQPDYIRAILTRRSQATFKQVANYISQLPYETIYHLFTTALKTIQHDSALLCSFMEAFDKTFYKDHERTIDSCNIVHLVAAIIPTCVKPLLLSMQRKGVDIETLLQEQNDRGNTPLHSLYASRQYDPGNQYCKGAVTLITKKVPQVVNIHNTQGHTPLERWKHIHDNMANGSAPIKVSTPTRATRQSTADQDKTPAPLTQTATATAVPLSSHDLYIT
tara:strand:- start:488 stop:1657 length:1170 start_codon:yes stop_codon:yes gene_type:complete